MKDIILKQGDCLELIKDISSESVDLVIADPPYFKVVNQKWDYFWKTEEEYIYWCEQWLKEVNRCLRKGGTFYLFGYFRTLVHLIPIAENIGLKFKQQIIINKGIQAISGRATKNYKMFPNVTESVLLFYKDPIPFSKKFLKERQKELKLTSKYINEQLGVKSNGGGMWSIYTGKNICEQLPTKENWEKLGKILKFDLKYENIAVTFNPQMGYTDVWDDINFYSEKRFHPTQKPLKLIERLVRASSNEKDVVLDPFMGGGSVGLVCKKLNRRYIGIELDEKYFKISQNRLTN